MPKVRCAVYTRKSTEEGLEQEFNSLDAQREACKAYIASQRHEGWVLLPDHYDDGGISGGHLDRPALQQLMEDVDENRVDQIVVYKIDRLTRSLADFAKLVDCLDAAGASFVSVTQSFNTATSMGRLTLNVLLSFAQFEREVTAERIRDKIAASKKKGLWMGGHVPLGYEPDERSLRINDDEADLIRRLYDLYEEHRALNAVAVEAERAGIRSRKRQTRAGEPRGGNVLSRGHIHHILTSPIYAGLIPHKGTIYEGQHLPIIEPDRWDRIQELLKASAVIKRGRRARRTHPSPLTGKLFDVSGERLTSSHSQKGKRRYRYYISRSLREKRVADITSPTWRLSAKPLETRVETEITSHLKRAIPRGLFVGIDATALDSLREDLEFRNVDPFDLISRAILEPGKLTLTLDTEQLAEWADVDGEVVDENLLTIQTTFTLRRRGVETRMVFEGETPERDDTLLKNIVRGQRFLEEIKGGRNVDDIAIAQTISPKRVQQILEFAFLSPTAVQAVMDANQPEFLNADWVLKNEIPVGWAEQAHLFRNA